MVLALSHLAVIIGNRAYHNNNKSTRFMILIELSSRSYNSIPITFKTFIRIWNITFKSFSPFYGDKFFSNWLGVVFAIKRKHGLLNWTTHIQSIDWICMISHEPIGGRWSVHTDILLLIIFMWTGHWWSLGDLSLWLWTICVTYNLARRIFFDCCCLPYAVL